MRAVSISFTLLSPKAPGMSRAYVRDSINIHLLADDRGKQRGCRGAHGGAWRVCGQRSSRAPHTWTWAWDGQGAVPGGRQTLLLSAYVLCISSFFSFFVTDTCFSVLFWRQNVRQKIPGMCYSSPPWLLCWDVPCPWTRTAIPLHLGDLSLSPYVHDSCHLLPYGQRP